MGAYDEIRDDLPFVLSNQTTNHIPLKSFFLILERTDSQAQGNTYVDHIYHMPKHKY